MALWLAGGGGGGRGVVVGGWGRGGRGFGSSLASARLSELSTRGLAAPPVSRRAIPVRAVGAGASPPSTPLTLTSKCCRCSSAVSSRRGGRPAVESSRRWIRVSNASSRAVPRSPSRRSTWGGEGGHRGWRRCGGWHAGWGRGGEHMTGVWSHVAPPCCTRAHLGGAIPVNTGGVCVAPTAVASSADSTHLGGALQGERESRRLGRGGARGGGGGGGGARSLSLGAPVTGA